MEAYNRGGEVAFRLKDGIAILTNDISQTKKVCKISKKR